MSGPIGKRWKLLGGVAVDSGQLMICDPCYIDEHWIKDQKPAKFPTVLLTEKGKKKFPRIKKWSWQYNGYGTTYESPQGALGGLSVNEALEQGFVQEIPSIPKREFSYRGCCDASQHDLYSMPTESGVMGIALAFSSGYGDGMYEVWGRTDNEGHIVEVRILMDE